MKRNSEAIRLGHFPLGSLESRAAARAESERRERARLENATVVIFTGLPTMFRGEQTGERPDGAEYHEATDGSIVRYWEAEHDRGLSVGIDQLWPDGELYDGLHGVESLAELHTLPRAGQAAIERLRRADA